MGAPPQITAATQTQYVVGLNQWVTLSQLIAVTGTGGDPIVSYTITDGNAAAGSAVGWAQGQYEAQGSTFTVPGSVGLGNIWIQGGSAASTDVLSISATDADGTSNLAQLTLVTSAAPISTPVVVANYNAAAVAIGQSVAASSLINITDADGDPTVLYRFWEAAGGTGLSLNGVAQAGGQNIDVFASNIGGLTYTGGSGVGSQVLWAQVYDGQAWSAWTSWTEQTVSSTSTPPAVGAANLNVNPGQWLKGAQLGVTVTDTAGGTPVEYMITDGNAGAGSAQLWLGGSYLAQGATATVTAAQWNNGGQGLWVQGGTSAGIDPLTVEVNDGYGWSAPITFNLTTYQPPVVTSTNTSVTNGQSIAAASLINVSGIDPVVTYRFWAPVSGGGAFSLNGVTQANGQNIDVAAANIGQLDYVGTVAASSETLWAQVYDGQSWSAWTNWTEQSLHVPTAVLTVSAANVNMTQTWFTAAQLGVTATNANGDTPLEYQITDGNASAGSAQLWLAGSYLAQGATVTVTAAQWNNGGQGLWVHDGTSASIDPLTVEVNDGYGWSAPITFNLTTYQPPVVTSTNTSVTNGQSIAAASLINVAGIDPVVTYRFWAPVSGGGAFNLNGVTQANGQNIDVAAANIGQLDYVGTVAASSETLWAQVYDGQSWSAWTNWTEQSLHVATAVLNVSAANVNITQTWFTAAQLGVTATNANGDTPVEYQITDGNASAGSAQLWLAGSYLAQGATVTVTAAQWNNGGQGLWVHDGTSASIDPLTVEVNDGFGWSAPTTFNLITYQPPVVTSTNTSVTNGQSIAAASLINVSGIDPVVTYRFWDSAGGGYFSLNGVTQASGQNIDVAAANIGQLDYVGTVAASSETLWAQVYDGQSWSAWTSWTEQSLHVATAVLNVSAANLNMTQTWLTAAQLGVTATNANGDTPVEYQITDGNASAGSAQLWLAGSYLAQGATVTVTAAQWNNGGQGLWVHDGTSASIDPLTVEVNDGFGWSAPTTFNLITYQPPVVTSTNTSVTNGQSIAAAALINVAGIDPVVTYRFWDSAGGGYFSLNGVTQASGQNIDVAAANIGQLDYVGTVAASSETLWAQVYDGQSWSAWTSWTEQSLHVATAVLNVSAANVNITQTWLTAAQLGVTATNANGDPPLEYQITDGNSAAGSAQLWLAGNYLAQGATVTVTAAQWNNGGQGLWVHEGTNAGIDPFTVEVNDGFGWSAPTTFNLITYQPPVVTSTNTSVTNGQSIAAAALINVAGIDPVVTYRFWDSAGGGYFSLNGVTQASGQNIDVAAANIGQLDYVGTVAASSETLWAQVYDGQSWSAWTSWTEQSLHVATAVLNVSAANVNITQTWLTAAQLGVTATNANGDPPLEYQITDGNSAAGSAQLWLAGNYLAQGATVTVTAAQWNNGGQGLWVHEGTNYAVDPLTVEVNDGFGWSAPTTFNLNTILPAAVTTSNLTVRPGSTTQAASMFTYVAAPSDPAVSYEFYDGSPYVGTFYLNGTAEPSKTNILVSAAQLSQLTYVAGSSVNDLGQTEQISVRASDGQTWTPWSNFNVSDYIAPPTPIYGTAGNDNMVAPGGISALVGGPGADSYTVSPGPGITFIYDADPGSGNSLDVPGAFTYGTQNAVGIVNGTDLVMADSSDRIVILMNWTSGENNIDSFTNGSTINWTTHAQVVANVDAAITGGYASQGITVQNYTWEQLGFSTAEINAAIQTWQQQLAQNIAVAQLESEFTSYTFLPPYADWKSVGLPSGGQAATSAAPWTDGSDTIFFGLGGTNVFNINDLNTAAVGGSGTNTYYAQVNGLGTYILANGNSAGGDKLVLPAIANLSTDALIVDNSDLIIGSPASGGGIDGEVVLLDWQNPANRINTFVIGNNTYTYAQFAAMVASANLTSVSWGQLGQDSTAWNAFVSGMQTFQSYLGATLTPTVATTNGHVIPNGQISLASLISGTDPGGPGITTYIISGFSGSGSIQLPGDGNVTPAGGNALPISASQLANYFVVPSAQGQSVSFTVQASDGLALSSTATVTVNELVDIPPVVTPGNLQALVGGRQEALTALFSATDTYGSIQTYEISNLTGVSSLANSAGSNLVYTGTPIDFAAGTLANLSVAMPNPAPTAVSMTVRAYDGLDWSQPVSITLPGVTDIPPVVTTNSQTLIGGHTQSLSSLISATDTYGSIETYEISNLTGISSFASSSGLALTYSGTPLDISAANLSTYSVLMPNPAPSTVSMTVRAFDGIDWSQPTTLTIQGVSDHPPVITPIPQVTLVGTPVSLASLFNVSDADGDPIVSYQLTNAANYSNFLYNGSPTSVPGLISASNLSQYSVTVSPGAGTTFSASLQASDGIAMGSATTISVSNAPNVAPVFSTTANQVEQAGTRVSLSSLFSASDSAEPILNYMISDLASPGVSTEPTIDLSDAPYLPSNGTSIVVSAANLVNLSIVTPTVAGAWVGFSVEADNGYQYGSPTEVSFVTAGGNGGPYPVVSGFGLSSATSPLGSVGTVANDVVLPMAESARLDSIVNVNPADAASVSDLEFQAIGANTGWSLGSYLVAGSTILTSSSTIDFSATPSELSSVYLHSRTYTDDTEEWQVRADTSTGWTGWTTFWVTTDASTPANLPADAAPSGVQNITLSASATNYAAWVGQRAAATYNFSVAAAGTLTLNFSGLGDNIEYGLTQSQGSTNAAVAPANVVGASSAVDAYNPGALVMGQSGGTANYNLAAGNYSIHLAPFSYGNTQYQLAVSYH